VQLEGDGGVAGAMCSQKLRHDLVRRRVDEPQAEFTGTARAVLSHQTIDGIGLGK
jgi:hypothetical protein